MLREYPLETPFGRLNIARGPANGPLLLLLHGFSNNWKMFLPILPTLIPAWEVVTFDHRGHGSSARIPAGYTAAEFYQDAVAAFEHLATADIYLLGHSMGGSMGLYLAQAYPEKVRGVVTGDTPLVLESHIQVMNNRRNTRLFGLRRRLAGQSPQELARRGLSLSQAEELSHLDPAVMDYHASSRVAEFFAGIRDVNFDLIRCLLFITQADPAKGGVLQDDEIPAVLARHPEFHFQCFDLGHDLDVGLGPQSAFYQAALAFLESIRPSRLEENA